MIRAFAVSLFALAAAVSAAHAEYYNLGDAVAGHPDAIYFDLAKALIPDLHLDASGGFTGTKALQVPFVQHVDGEEDPTPPEVVNLFSVEAMPFEAEGRDFTLMLAGMGPVDGWVAEYEVLAIFDEDLKLVDALNIGMDRVTEIRDDAPIRISKQDEAILTYSEHFNSNQTYGQQALIFFRHGKLQVIDIIGVFSDRWCGHDQVQELAITSPDAGDGLWPITATVTDTLLVATDEDCGEAAPEVPFTRSYAATYNWDASLGKYAADSQELDALARYNQGRF
jgi:hypothetical protein